MSAKVMVSENHSAGGSFTPHTNESIMKIYDWIQAHPDEILTYAEFQRSWERDIGLKPSNVRTFFPLMKYCGMVNYEKGKAVKASELFTNQGKAFVKSLQLEEMARNELAKQKAKEFVSLEILYGLLFLLKTHQSSYADTLMMLIKYLCQHSRIDKKEFAIMLEKNGNVSDETIQAYRNYQLDIDVDVKIRNDENDDEKYAKQDASYLTSWSYLIRLLCQAGLVIEKNEHKEGYAARKYYWVIENRKKFLETMVKSRSKSNYSDVLDTKPETTGMNISGGEE